MVDTGADDGQAEGRVHRGVEGKRLQRNVALVMIHTDEGSGASPPIGEKGGVGRDWSLDEDAALPCEFHRGFDQGFLLAVAEESVLSGMGVEP